MAEAGKSRPASRRADGISEREDPDRSDPQYPGDDDQESVRDRFEQANDRAPSGRRDMRESKREQHREHNQRQYVAVGSRSENIVGDDAFEEIRDSGQRAGRRLLDSGKRGLKAMCGVAREWEQLGQ